MASLYTTRAEDYDRIYASKPYGTEAQHVRALLHEAGVADGASVCEAACGTGQYLVHLAHWFDAQGFDLHEDMLALARRKLPNMSLQAMDMRDFRLAAPVDAVLCLFSSIGYLLTDEDLGRALASFHGALRPGGVLVIEPWVAPEAFRPGTVYQDSYSRPSLQLTRHSFSRCEGDLAVLEFHWLVGRANEGIEHFVEEHRVRLLSREDMLRHMAAAGFEARFTPDGLMRERGLFLATRSG